MSETKTRRLGQVARQLNVGTTTIVTHLASQGFHIESAPNAKITSEQYTVLAEAFADAAIAKEEAMELVIGKSYEESVAAQPDPTTDEVTPTPCPPAAELYLNTPSDHTPTVEPLSTAVDTPLPPTSMPPTEQPLSLMSDPKRPELTIVGKVNLSSTDSKRYRPVASSDTNQVKKRRLRKRMVHKPQATHQASHASTAPAAKNVQEQIKSTLAKLEEDKKGAANRAKYRREKKSMLAEAREEKRMEAQQAAKTLEVTEFVSANDLASLMNVSINEVLSTCMTLGMTISINQRLDAEAITVITDEFGYQVTFKDIQSETLAETEPDSPADLTTRAPIVTIMGHVDHGKTSLIDYIRNTQITEGEAGGITQHIGAYDVVTQQGKRIAVLDTPGHEAFTAMRARGAKLTDVAIIVIAADDGVRPQTKEAINHAQLASVPLVFAFNKIDKPEANPEKVKEELAQMNILVEDWGGKYQSQAIAAKTGQGIDALLEKVLFEADLLDLKANPHKRAQGTVIEATLDQGRGYVTTLMVQTGTLRQGDVVLAGAYYGKVKAMLNHQGKQLIVAEPSVPVQILGLDGAPQAGDGFVVLQAEKEARAIVAQRQQILREQSFRTKKHITLEEIGRRLAVGNFKELNIILKGDVDGSVEAMADSLIKLSTPEIQVNIVQKGVGAISESDVLLAAATDAIVIGFQVRPSVNARKLAEKEDIEIRLYSVIYDAINHVKDAMQGMLAPRVEEVITGNATVREVFKISKVGTVAGCYLTQGCLKRHGQVRLIRDGIVVHTGTIKQIKQFKQEVQQVKMEVECGISLGNFKDIRIEDVIEGFEEKKVERQL